MCVGKAACARTVVALKVNRGSVGTPVRVHVPFAGETGRTLPQSAEPTAPSTEGAGIGAEARE